MAKSDTIRVLVLASEFDSARLRLKGSFSRTNLEVLETVSIGEFLSRLRDFEPQVLVIATDAVGSASFESFLADLASEYPEIPVVALGSEQDDERDAVRYLEEGAADYLPVSLIEHLPRALQRAYSDSENSRRISSLQDEVQRAHSALLDNQKLMGIGRLAGSIAHEINNPLESITNLLYLLRTDGSLSSSARSYVELAEREMGRVAQISKQTLNFYRETQTPVRVRPADLLDEVLVLYGRRIEEKRIAVVRQYKSDVSLLVYPGEMRQVLSNLVANAIEASPFGGKLALRVRRARRWSDEGIEGVRIAVADSGCGIPADIRQHLGQLFYTTKGQRGTGLGLWVTRAIIKRYGGEIQLFSSTQPHRHGTCFSIFLPTNMRPRAVVMNGSAATSGRPAGVASTGTHEFGTENVWAKNRRRRDCPLAAS
jgi:signal transduction histidine kinase